MRQFCLASCLTLERIFRLSKIMCGIFCLYSEAAEDEQENVWAEIKENIRRRGPDHVRHKVTSGRSDGLD